MTLTLNEKEVKEALLSYLQKKFHTKGHIKLKKLSLKRKSRNTEDLGSIKIETE